jgi:hypothetical protein
VKKAAPGLQYVFDTVVSDKTVYTASQCLENNEGLIGTAITYTGSPLPGSVEVKPVFSGAIFGKTMSGEDDTAGSVLGVWLWERLPGWLEKGEIKPLEHEVVGGLDQVPEGLRRLREEQARAPSGALKLVITP